MSELRFEDVLNRRRSQRDFSNDAIERDSLKRLIGAVQAKTNLTGGRPVPSAHGLHPLRLYVAVSRVNGLNGGFYSVDPETSELDMIHDRDIRTDLQDAAVDEQIWIGNAAAIISVCADFVAPCRNFADQQPLGRRGSRYVYIEAGAAAQNLQLQATVESIGSVLVAGFNDEATAAVLGLAVPVAPVLHVCLGVAVLDLEE